MCFPKFLFFLFSLLKGIFCKDASMFSCKRPIYGNKCDCFIRAQSIMKARLKGAQTGRNLLKKKADALSMRFRQILRKIIEVKCQAIDYSLFLLLHILCNTLSQMFRCY